MESESAAQMLEAAILRNHLKEHLEYPPFNGKKGGTRKKKVVATPAASNAGGVVAGGG